MFKYQNVYLFFKKLTPLYKNDFQYFFEEITNTNKKDYILNDKMSIILILKLVYFLIRLYISKNVYHSIGYKKFIDLKFKVNKYVLIPRFETELLLQKVKRYINDDLTIQSVIDLGTGSGVIAIYLKKCFPKLKVTAIDISKRALVVARKNANKYNVLIEFKNSTFKNFTLSDYDVIVSNPPYINKSDTIDNNVYNTEPHSALFADNNGLLFYEQIIEKCSFKNKLIAFEIGEKQGLIIKKMILKKFPKADVTIEQDFNGCDRYVFAKIKR